MKPILRERFCSLLSGYSFLVIKSSCLYAHSQVLGGLPIEGDFLDIKYPEDLCIDYHS